MILLVFSLGAVLILIPALALRGAARRGAYLAGALLTAVLAFGCYELVDAPPTPNPTPSEAVGQEVISEYGPPVFFSMVAVVLAFLVGAALYRPSQAETKICPHCAERIQAAATICRFCSQSVPASAMPPAELVAKDNREKLQVRGTYILVAFIVVGIVFQIVASWLQ